eukprot:gene15941-biopygen7969
MLFTNCRGSAYERRPGRRAWPLQSTLGGLRTERSDDRSHHSIIPVVLPAARNAEWASARCQRQRKPPFPPLDHPRCPPGSAQRRMGECTLPASTETPVPTTRSFPLSSRQRATPNGRVRVASVNGNPRSHHSIIPLVLPAARNAEWASARCQRQRKPLSPPLDHSRCPPGSAQRRMGECTLP